MTLANLFLINSLAMVKVAGLDIPAGLEEAYFSILNWANLTFTDKLNIRKRPTARYSRSRLAQQSLMVIFEPTWDGLLSSQRTAWHMYWGGWPGSGYSAFIQINAPRYAAGLSLLLDPPTGLGPELLRNPFFVNSLHPWSQDSENYLVRLADGGGIIVPENEDAYFQNLWQFPAGLATGWYRLGIVCAVPDGINFEDSAGIGFAFASSPEAPLDPVAIASNSFVSTLYEGDRHFVTDDEPQSVALNFSGDPGNGNIYVYSVSCRKIL